MIYKRIIKKAEENGFKVYDYFINDMYTENKYYLTDIFHNVIGGFDRQIDLEDYLEQLINED